MVLLKKGGKEKNNSTIRKMYHRDNDRHGKLINAKENYLKDKKYSRRCDKRIVLYGDNNKNLQFTSLQPELGTEVEG